MHAPIPAIEIPFGETFREASQAVAACAHLRFRWQLGDDRFVRPLVGSSLGLKSIAGLEDNNQMTTRERVAQLMKAWPKVYPTRIASWIFEPAPVACGDNSLRAIDR